MRLAALTGLGLAWLAILSPAPALTQRFASRGFESSRKVTVLRYLDAARRVRDMPGSTVSVMEVIR